MNPIPNIKFKFTALALACLACSGIANAAEGFKVRYPSAGTLGPELALFNVQSGVIGSMQINSTSVTKITGNDGQQAWLPPSVNAKGTSQTALADLTQHATVMQLLGGYITPADYAGGSLAFAINVPITLHISRNLSFPQVSATLKNGQPTTPGAAYLAGLDAQAQANTTSTQGLGDADLSAAWISVRGNLKTSVGVNLVVPTGQFHSLASGAAGTPAINIGSGHFYTLRTSGTVAYQASENLTLGTRVGLAFNSTNSVDNWRSGNFATLDMAASYKTSIGVFGPQLISINQYQDDTGGLSGNQPGGYGANRYRATGLGLFYATRINNFGLNVGYTSTIASANALASNILQVRLTKAF